MTNMLENLTPVLKQTLQKDFKTDNSIKKAILNKEIYKFSNLNSNQIQKIFKIDAQNILVESNSKKHLQKIYDMIRQNFIYDESSNYLHLFLYPTNNIEIYNLRKEIFSNLKDDLNLNYNKTDLKNLIKNIDEFSSKINFSKTIYSLEKSFVDYLYDNFKITAFFISSQELEEIMSGEERDFIVISDENLFIEAPLYSTNDFKKLLKGILIKNNSKQVLEFANFIDFIKNDLDLVTNKINQLSNLNFEIKTFDFNKLKNIISTDKKEELKKVAENISNLEVISQGLNEELKEIISKKKLSLDGDELLEVLNSGDLSTLQKKFESEIKEKINEKQKELIDNFKTYKIKTTHIFENKSYPVKIDEEVISDLLNQVESLSEDSEFETFLELGNFDLKIIKSLWNFVYFFDFLFGISSFIKKYELNYPQITNELKLIDCKNIYINSASPISYGLGISNINNVELNNEKISVLTGANSGGKTTLLEMFLQSQILTVLGLGISGDKNSEIKFCDEIIYLKKFTGTQGSGAFEQTIRNLIEILDKQTSKLVLIDEFEAITEPGAAAKILIEFLCELSKGENYCIAVSHLGQEIKEFIKEKEISSIRIDGISATGLDEKGNLITNHQPQFYELGKSTPELILKRILSDEKFWKDKTGNGKDILERISK